MLPPAVLLPTVLLPTVLLLAAMPLAGWHGMARAQSLQQGVESLAQAVAPKLAKAGVASVVVADFPGLKGQYCALGSYLAERLTTQLAGTQGLKVLERSLLSQALQEMKMTPLDLADSEKAKQVGLRLGAESAVLGALSDLGPTVELDARVNRLATGETLYSGFTVFAKSPAVDQLMVRDCGAAAVPQASTSGPATFTPGEPTYQNEAYKISFDSVQKLDNIVTMLLTIENTTDKPFKFAFRSNSYLQDDQGERWEQADTDSAILWAWGKDFDLADLVPQVRVRTRLKFKAQGGTQGREFTMVAREFRPQEGRNLAITGLKAQ